MRRDLLVLAILVTGGLAGCLGETDRSVRHDPWPQERYWPADLEGPFSLGTTTRHQVTSHDGTRLDGWVLLPEAPAGTQLPVALTISPYFGGAQTHPAAPDFVARCCANIPVGPLIAAGYAVALWDVRGSGGSDGCIDFFGSDERQDHQFVIEWLAAQPWSNGRVGMVGYSYDGGTAWSAAVTAPPALKTIVTGGIIADAYTRSATPQGALDVVLTTNEAMVGPTLAYGSSTAIVGPDDLDRLVPAAARPCPDFVQHARLTQFVDGDRDATYWDERRTTDFIAEVRAAVWIVQGMQDLPFQSSHLWPYLDHVPSRITQGQWGHRLPGSPWLDNHPSDLEWSEMLVQWFDFWLKGIGNDPGVGEVEYQDLDGNWHIDVSWPPSTTAPRAFWLDGGRLSTEPGAASATFSAVPDSSGYGGMAVLQYGDVPGVSLQGLCLDTPASHVYWSMPLESDALLAGDPWALLEATSDQPGGIISLDLFTLDPDFACGTLPGTHTGTGRLVSHGAADLRHHGGNLVAMDFPTNTATPIRVDLWFTADSLPAGSRIALQVHHGRSTAHLGEPYYPSITLEAPASHLVLPLGTEGETLGSIPLSTYPRRPFLPPVA